MIILHGLFISRLLSQRSPSPTLLPPISGAIREEKSATI